jgi:large subunit ribosomal protein L15
MLTLNNIKKAKGASKNKKRVGRGNSSGHGTYSTRGLKGQKARSGVSGLKRLGMKQQLLQTPKVRGFKSAKPKNQIISLKDINSNYKDGENVTPESLAEKGLISSANLPVKILGKTDKLTVKVKFAGVKMSAGVLEQTK